MHFSDTLNVRSPLNIKEYKHLYTVKYLIDLKFRYKYLDTFNLQIVRVQLLFR